MGRTHITGFIYINPEGAKQMAGTERSLAAGGGDTGHARRRAYRRRRRPAGRDPLVSWMLPVVSRVYTNIETYQTV